MKPLKVGGTLAATRRMETARSPSVDGNRGWSTKMVFRLGLWYCNINPSPEKELGNGAC